MKIGDLVKADFSDAVGIVVDIINKKVWRVHDKGVKVNWDKVEPELHASVLYAHNCDTVNIPVAELEVI
tara:strand:+ start:68 stop:274 length:207 start_codon:yes stop_codon:yes gene_type:complete